MFKMSFKLPKNTWRLLLLISVVLVILAIPKFTWAQQTSSSLICPGDLPASVSSIIKRSQLTRSRLGISLQTLSDGDSLLDLDSSSFFIPASNAKLLTTAAALESLGSDFTFSTSFVWDGSNLFALGMGDPSLTSQQLASFAEQLKTQGVQSIQTLQVVNKWTNSFKGSWEWGDSVFDYAAPSNSVNLNQNTFSVTLTPSQVGETVKISFSDLTAANFWKINNLVTTTTETNQVNVIPHLGNNTLDLTGYIDINSPPVSLDLSIPDPSGYFLDIFSQSLEKAGIKVKEKYNIQQFYLGFKVPPKITQITSKPLSEMIKTVNQDSNNFYAASILNALAVSYAKNDIPYLMLKKIGVKESDFKLLLTLAFIINQHNVLEILNKTLEKIGVDPAGFSLVDGSGLSRQNLVSPQALVQTLRAMNKSEYAKIYRDSLAIAGESGTLINRFKNTPVQGNLQAKTGTMTGVSSLSGYLNPPHYQPLVLSIIINNSTLSSSDLRQVIDEIVLLFNQLKPC